MKLLLAEDEPDVQLIARLSLKKAGFTVVTVGNGVEVLERVAGERPDLILLDANMPGMDGYTVCRLLKGDAALASTPVLFITARSSLDARAAGLTLGADDYLVKPVDMAELMLRIQVLLARRTQAVRG
jgi:DNA-binding response OmpR family regulator